MRSDPPGPLGERFTCPSAASGALPTKNMGCRATQSRRWSVIASYVRATGAQRCRIFTQARTSRGIMTTTVMMTGHM